MKTVLNKDSFKLIFQLLVFCIFISFNFVLCSKQTKPNNNQSSIFHFCFCSFDSSQRKLHFLHFAIVGSSMFAQQRKKCNYTLKELWKWKSLCAIILSFFFSDVMKYNYFRRLPLTGMSVEFCNRYPACVDGQDNCTIGRFSALIKSEKGNFALTQNNGEKNVSQFSIKIFIGHKNEVHSMRKGKKNFIPFK